MIHSSKVFRNVGEDCVYRGKFLRNPRHRMCDQAGTLEGFLWSQHLVMTGPSTRLASVLREEPKRSGAAVAGSGRIPAVRQERFSQARLAISAMLSGWKRNHSLESNALMVCLLTHVNRLKLNTFSCLCWSSWRSSGGIMYTMKWCTCKRHNIHCNQRGNLRYGRALPGIPPPAGSPQRNKAPFNLLLPEPGSTGLAEVTLLFPATASTSEFRNRTYRT